tara:strand:- start:799 stop:1557 length:759 start_codon:yes stop_codon:yes gene_type:complete
MPNLPMHIYLANQAAEQLDWGSIQDHVGSFFLGSTTPDIRAMTGWPRERTHFATLSLESVGTGVRTMLESYPNLADPGNQTPATRAFILGYISHLVADEVWITTMYRTYFDGENNVACDDIEANMWDRTLQLEMDRKTFAAMDGLHQAAEDIICGDQSVDVGFLEVDLLQEWREWVGRFMTRDFSWDRLKRAMNRMYRDNDDVQQTVDKFLQGMPYSLERIYEKIPEERLDAYQAQVLAQTVSHAREYMSGV